MPRQTMQMSAHCTEIRVDSSIVPSPVAQDMEHLEDKSGTLGLLVTTVEKGWLVTIHKDITASESPRPRPRIVDIFGMLRVVRRGSSCLQS